MTRKFSGEWWQNKEVTIPESFLICSPFFQQDQSLVKNDEIYKTIGLVLYQHPNGETVPAGMTAVKDGNFIFQYHPDYIKAPENPPLSVHLPKRPEPYINSVHPDISFNLPRRPEAYSFEGKMPAFFDNLPSEGWFGKAQGAALGQNPEKVDGDNEAFDDRYHRLLMFGRDCPGAVSVTYITLDPQIAEEQYQETVKAALRSRSSISGVQPKLLGIIEDGKLRPTKYWETSTHIIKLPSDKYPNLIESEYMSILATKALLPNDKTVDAALDKLHLLDGSTRDVLSIRRFDRTPEGGKIHFEEFNQLLGKQNAARYEGAYADMAKFIRSNCEPSKANQLVKQLYARLVSQLLLGNTDSHFKNFAMFRDKENHWEFTPNYDLAPNANYDKTAVVALKIGTEKEYWYRDIYPKQIANLGFSLGLNADDIREITSQLKANVPAAIAAVQEDTNPRLDSVLRENFVTLLEKRTKFLFGSLDKFLSYHRGGSPSPNTR